MRINDFLKNHTIVKIGRPLSGHGYICCETIVDDPKALIPIVRRNNCYISEIRWWDRVDITSISSIGYGGPRDPRSPDSHYFAETDICMTFARLLPDNEYFAYLERIKKTYSGLDLFPAFDIKNNPLMRNSSEFLSCTTQMTKEKLWRD